MTMHCILTQYQMEKVLTLMPLCCHSRRRYQFGVFLLGERMRPFLSILPPVALSYGTDGAAS